MPKKCFQRTIENFTCERCGRRVAGNGYTNHCPQCLWSKHVDENPGDRAETCGGMMEPVGIEVKEEKYVIAHKCIRCGLEKKNKASEDDNMNEIIKLSSKI